MKEIRILYLYPDILDLYGDIGNIKVLKYRIEQRGMKCIVDTYSIDDEAPDFSCYKKGGLVTTPSLRLYN